MKPDDWMRRAIEQAQAAIETGQTPFGAVVVRHGELIAEGHNEVWKTGDPTAHAEVVAIRRAAAALGSIDLSGCEMYATCEPCPMCAAAIHWAKLDAIHYGATIADAQRAGFSELALAAEKLYELGDSPVRVMSGVLAEPCAQLFNSWKASGNSSTY
jgi:tRNA(Arg) A34 adenosine deaminase TadA